MAKKSPLKPLPNAAIVLLIHPRADGTFHEEDGVLTPMLTFEDPLTGEILPPVDWYTRKTLEHWNPMLKHYTPGSIESRRRATEVRFERRNFAQASARATKRRGDLGTGRMHGVDYFEHTDRMAKHSLTAEERIALQIRLTKAVTKWSTERGLAPLKLTPDEALAIGKTMLVAANAALAKSAL